MTYKVDHLTPEESKALRIGFPHIGEVEAEADKRWAVGTVESRTSIIRYWIVRHRGDIFRREPTVKELMDYRAEYPIGPARFFNYWYAKAFSAKVLAAIKERNEQW